MREIKFRLWDESNKGYLKPEMFNVHLSKGIVQANNSAGQISGVILEQFTGVTDKNGTEVYEGDIIRLFDNDNGFFEVVFRNEYVGGWNLLFEGKTTSLGARKSFEIEIVGNIHE